MYANPADIIAICKCDDAAFEMLSGTRDAGESAAAVADEASLCRSRCTYSCFKGEEPSTLLIGIRDGNGSTIECVDCTRPWHKKERTKSKPGSFVNSINLAVFHIVVACRSRGLTVDVAGWIGWTTPGRKPRADSLVTLFSTHLGNTRSRKASASCMSAVAAS